METHGQLLKKLIKRKKLTQAQAAEMLGFPLIKLTRLLNKERIDEVTLEEVEKIFQVPPAYFPLPDTQAPPMAGASQPNEQPNCWQLLAEARQHIIQLQQQIIEMSQAGMTVPAGRAKEKGV